jgi:hypothetical protein
MKKLPMAIPGASIVDRELTIIKDRQATSEKMLIIFIK